MGLWDRWKYPWPCRAQSLPMASWAGGVHRGFLGGQENTHLAFPTAPPVTSAWQTEPQTGPSFYSRCFAKHTLILTAPWTEADVQRNEWGWSGAVLPELAVAAQPQPGHCCPGDTLVSPPVSPRDTQPQSIPFQPCAGTIWHCRAKPTHHSTGSSPDVLRGWSQRITKIQTSFHWFPLPRTGYFLIDAFSS